jgi:hypothetical protein
LTDLACVALEEHLHPGINEQEILSLIYNAYLKHGGDPSIHFIASTCMDDPDRLSLGSVLRKGFGDWQCPYYELTVSYWGYSTQTIEPLRWARTPGTLPQTI